MDSLIRDALNDAKATLEEVALQLVNLAGLVGGLIDTVVLSSSSHESDIRKARASGARDYFVKPHALSDLAGIIGRIGTRWLPATAS